MQLALAVKEALWNQPQVTANKSERSNYEATSQVSEYVFLPMANIRQGEFFDRHPKPQLHNVRYV